MKMENRFLDLHCSNDILIVRLVNIRSHLNMLMKGCCCNDRVFWQSAPFLMECLTMVFTWLLLLLLIPKKYYRAKCQFTHWHCYPLLPCLMQFWPSLRNEDQWAIWPRVVDFRFSWHPFLPIHRIEKPSLRCLLGMAIMEVVVGVMLAVADVELMY